VRVFLDGIDAEWVSVPGTALADAMRTAVRAFATDGKAARRRVVVILSDGEDHEGGLQEALRVLAQGGVVAHALGCGSSRGAPIPEAGGAEGFRKDRDGKIVTTRLDESTLSGLAVATGGRYFRATPSASEVDEIAKEIAAMEGREAGAVMRTRYVDRFQFPLVLALAALLAEAFVADRASKGRRA
jgi:Ca-activated chloride channel family protein